MEDKICGFCSYPAEFICNCTSKASYICSKHVGSHYKLKGKHEINQIKLTNFLLNPEMKAKLLDKIYSLKTQAKLDIKTILAHANNLITKISENLKKTSGYMICFIKSCDDAIYYIKSLNEIIEEKEFYCPLESLLTMQDPEILDQIYGPKINLYPINRKTIESAISNFPHCIFQYTFKALDFSSKKVIICKNNTIETKMMIDFSWVGRLLSIGKKIGIYTGGDPASNNAYIIDLELKSIHALPSMQQKRCLHAMTWIDGFPAVLGGYDGEVGLDVVEVYKNGNWERYPSLTSKKYSISAISHYSKVYVFGGRINNEKDQQRLNSIEKYENGKWELLTVKMSSNLSSPGLFASGTYIVIFGGRDESKYRVKNCDIFNDELMKVWKADFELKEPLYFTSSNALTSKGEIYYYGSDKYETIHLANLDFNF